MEKHYNYFFLDRDGVINTNGFVNTPDEFEFIDGSLEALKKLFQFGCQSFVITNQGGLEAGYLTDPQVINTLIWSKGALW